MSDRKTHSNNLSTDKANPEIHWISLWQASGNDWSWMIKQECLASLEQKAKTNKLISSRQLIALEILATAALLVTALAMQAYQTSQTIQLGEASNLQAPATFSDRQDLSYQIERKAPLF